MKCYIGVNRMQFNIVFLHIHIHVMTFKCNVLIILIILRYWRIFKILIFVFVYKFTGIYPGICPGKYMFLFIGIK